MEKGVGETKLPKATLSRVYYSNKRLHFDIIKGQFGVHYV